MNFYVGTSGHSYKEWKGAFYPDKLPAKQMLNFYGEHFRTVEINYTFKRLPTASVVAAWTDAVPADFQFALKAPERITHFKRLNDVGDVLAKFLDVARTFEKRLGPLLFQLPPNFKKDTARLRAFLKLFPRRRRRVAFEFRHASWFDDEIFKLLLDRGVALCIADEKDELVVPFVGADRKSEITEGRAPRKHELILGSCSVAQKDHVEHPGTQSAYRWSASRSHSRSS
jgi:uncharacterized protein YecE (DUF72 family)